MTDDTVNIEIDGRPCTARKGQMIIEVSDVHDAYIPRFCYHKKLSVAANCRMCLVEVENVPKPLPACATPVNEGMKVWTRSPRAIAAQKATMEFLLINHPLDCPICDQGGECELQDLAMGYGSDASRYTEGKRVVRDKNLGPLVSTDMTRCIQCTRCVRFGQEIAGIQELGTIGRGERMEIGTYVEQSVCHEMSGNIIDLCPVGALNSKPFRYRARSWEMTQIDTIAAHDCVGSNLYAHVCRGRLMRIVPRDNEAINETWISDRDRFSYEGIYSDDRLLRPMVREGGEWRETDWSSALNVVADGLRSAVAEAGPARLGILTSPWSTLEEHFLAARLGRGLGTHNIDHRLMRRDFSHQDREPPFPSLGLSLEALERADGVALVGCDVRSEAPIVAHRVRKAAVGGGRVGTLGAEAYPLLFPVTAQAVQPDGDLVQGLVATLTALDPDIALPPGLQGLARAVTALPEHRALAEMLRDGKESVVIVGMQAHSHPAFGTVRALASILADLTGSVFGCLTPGPNSAGGAIAGALPHRNAGGEPVEKPGLDVAAMLARPLSAYLIQGFEPEWDTAAGGDALPVLAAAGLVVTITPYVTDAMRGYASVLLPAGTHAETAGTFVNCEGRWQGFPGVAQPLGEARPAWKILRVLGTLLEIPGMEFGSVDEIRAEIEAAVNRPGLTGDRAGKAQASYSAATASGTDWTAIYGCDPVVRRAPALQATLGGRQGWRRSVA